MDSSLKMQGEYCIGSMTRCLLKGSDAKVTARSAPNRLVIDGEKMGSS
jgi:hypothetical protein